jgi:integrase
MFAPHRLHHPSLLSRPISPHTIRHTTATHLLRSGVDINTIRAWLGHVSIDTTNIYAEVDLQRKAEVLAHSNNFSTTPTNQTSPGKTTRPCSPSSAPSK